MARISTHRVLVVAVNLVVTTLTLLTGFRENAVVGLVMGRFGLIRSRLLQGRINYNITSLDHLPSHVLPDLSEVATSFKFHRAPTRSPANVGEDRSTCLRVNSMNTTVLAVYFDDLFGKGPRREQLFVWSISAPHCDVINLKPAWVKNECVSKMFPGNETACSEYILANFNQLKRDRSVQVGVAVDFGVVGAPFLKCKGQRGQAFQFMTDLMVMQSFWAGGSFQIEFQSSVCSADAALITSMEGLYRVKAANQSSSMAVAVPPPHWIAAVISSVYSVMLLLFIIQGLQAAVVSTSKCIYYFPASTKRAILGGLGRLVPSTAMLSWLVPIHNRVEVFRFHGQAVVAANLWMNHWFYILISIMDACIHVRSVYMMLTMGAWMLTKRMSFDNFLFMCTPLTKVAWITCLAHTILQRLVRLIVEAAQSFVHGGRGARYLASIQWYMESAALFTNFKFYAVMLVVQLYTVLKIKGTPMISTRAPNPKRPVYGGYPDLAPLWGCEIAVDLLVLVAIQLTAAHIAAGLLLLTKFRRVTRNRVLRILQRRYLFVGWDAFVAMDAMGIHPHHNPIEDDDGNEVATTKCSGGVLLRQLYASGPSGWVRLVGENALLAAHGDTNIGHGADENCPRRSKSSTMQRYPISVAERMGLYKRVLARSRIDNANCGGEPNAEKPMIPTTLFARAARSVQPDPASPPQVHRTPATLTDSNNRRAPSNLGVLHAHIESTWGRLILLDFVHHPAYTEGSRGDASDKGQLTEGRPRDDDEARTVVAQDAMHQLNAEMRKALLDGDLKLRIC